MEYASAFDTPIGRIVLLQREDAIAGLFFGRDIRAAGAVKQSTPLLELAAAQVREYLAGARVSFDLPLSVRAGAFSLDVYAALRRIPYGQTRTYGQIAQSLGKPSASRAVGAACRTNPISLIIPCHRVVGANGSLTGYAGGLETKRFLLALEGAPGRA